MAQRQVTLKDIRGYIILENSLRLHRTRMRDAFLADTIWHIAYANPIPDPNPSPNPSRSEPIIFPSIPCLVSGRRSEPIIIHSL